MYSDYLHTQNEPKATAAEMRIENNYYFGIGGAEAAPAVASRQSVRQLQLSKYLCYCYIL